ncbi:MmgE/PrpD family protein [Pseudoruegeria sp. SHC-113]|uniref:MmgE/PrpD family protein n=1 Tax=Pseudoruegeria sp. SHC-113 TaxID=2855439 RepID=UPI0021BB63E1|nr:MmgE/PrpD family protein [Pseudoruegeria sp. SHC-113]MCT8158890.1 MmgE/PrpD family protein [Pseudoruegeria sp. SHC-113]
MSFTDAIAGFVTETPESALPESARAVIRLSLLDWLSVGRAGIEEPVSRIVADLVLAEAGMGEASGFGQAQRLPARAAALLNGTTSHALDYDDTHFLHIGHPSVTVFPAALAVAERQGATGAEFLAACVLGYEASCRIGHWLGRAHYQVGYHQTATAGCFGAALAAGRLLKLDRAQMAQVIGLASTRAAGLKSQFGTMGKPYNAGQAASAGVEAALLVAFGMGSTPAGLDGPQGFGETHHGEANREALAGLGEVFVLEGTSYKFHACCHGTHAALEALRALLPVEDLETIDSVQIHTHPRWLSVCNIANPQTGLEAKFSYRLTAAMALAGVETGALESFSDETCALPTLTALRDRVEVVADEGIAESASHVSLRLNTGQTREAHHDLNAEISLHSKALRLREKSIALLGLPMAEAVSQAVMGLAGAADVTALGALLRADP